jgi:hypothetical protein
MVARTERSPGFGPPLAFPVSQWLMSGVNAGSVPACPLQWRGRAGITPASERPRSWVFDCEAAASLGLPGRRRKRSL